MPVPFAALVAVVATCWLPPVDAPVVDPFRAPACTWCPGNRGIEYGPVPGQTVVAVEAGTVSFAGSVARVAYVVVLHDDGIRATYGRLEQIGVVTGQRVSAGQRLGTTTGRFYFGLRDGNTPVDPTPLIGRRTWPARLVPMDGTPARPVAPLGPVCPADARGNGRPGR